MIAAGIERLTREWFNVPHVGSTTLGYEVYEETVDLGDGSPIVHTLRFEIPRDVASRNVVVAVADLRALLAAVDPDDAGGAS